MVNYQNGKIYTIRCRSDEKLIYVGSTTQTLSQRMTQHRSKCKNKQGISLYKYIIDDDWSNWYIELYEMYPCNEKCELEKREGEITREIGTINYRKFVGRTSKEYYNDTKEHYAELMKKNYEKNKEYYLQKRKERYEKNKEYYLQQCKNLRIKNKNIIIKCDVCNNLFCKNWINRHKCKIL